jgi:excisionase family DNA binding protein
MSTQYTILPSGRLRAHLSPIPRATANIFLTANEAADLLNISRVTLARWRLEGSGPPFCKFGRTVRYERAALLSWARSRARRSTSE